jgi:hypothetical protein
MIQLVSIAAIGAIIATVLMVVVMLYLVWWALDGDAHAPTPDTQEDPELDDGAETDDAQAELTADGDAA